MAEAAKKKRNPPVEAVIFIRTWQEARTVAEVCTKIGMQAASASQRATNLRKKGIKLKKMPRNTALVNIEKLKKLASDLAAPHPA